VPGNEPYLVKGDFTRSSIQDKENPL
jgi:hypothetical protein